ncbi:MAG TPA: hypothetical protein VEX60_08600 [Pyrinomonadaceae bacterium]|nr:hypothetical protein [Pyrinomonadaceae bacterium]
MKRALLSLLFAAAASSVALGQTPARGVEVVDRMVAVVNGRELITYSDLLWQLALQPGVPLDSPRQEDLRRALDLLVDQRLIAQEAGKLPSVAPTEKEIEEELKRLIGFFNPQSEFYSRLSRVGLGESSAQLREIVQERVRIQKYLDFRFRSFTVVTPQEIEAYYRDVYVPRRRRQSPGQIIPELKTVFDELKKELIENKIESDTDDFLEEARAAAQITILDETLRGGG